MLQSLALMCFNDLFLISEISSSYMLIMSTWALCFPAQPRADLLGHRQIKYFMCIRGLYVAPESLGW